MTSVSNTNSILSQLIATKQQQPVEDSTQAAAQSGVTSKSASPTASNATSPVIGDAYVDASQAIVTYLLNQPDSVIAESASTSLTAAAATPASTSSPTGATASDGSTASPARGSGGGGGRGGASASSSTTTTAEKLPDGEMIEIKTDSKGAVVSETVVQAAPQSSSHPDASTLQAQLPQNDVRSTRAAQNS
jgi:hypothetical protein